MSRADDRPAFIAPHVEFVICHGCGDAIDPEDARGIDVSGPDEYYPEMKPLCPSCNGGEN